MAAEYKSIIELNRNLSADELQQASRVIKEAFCNRAGSVNNVSDEPYILIFEGNEPEWGCLNLGDFIVRDNPIMKNKIKSWRWVDADPSECVDTLRIFREQGANI